MDLEPYFCELDILESTRVSIFRFRKLRTDREENSGGIEPPSPPPAEGATPPPTHTLGFTNSTLNGGGGFEGIEIS